MNFEKRLAGVAASTEVIRRGVQVREDRMDKAACAILDGNATLAQYELHCGQDVQQARKRWAPTITVGFARRHLGLDTGWRSERAWLSYLPGDVLSHRPEELLSKDLQACLERMDDLWRDASQDAEQRIAAATARLIVGSADGEARRAQLWSGTGQKLARKKSCDYQRWWNACLLGVWEEVLRTLTALVVADRNDVSEGHYIVAPYAVYEHLLWNNYGS